MRQQKGYIKKSHGAWFGIYYRDEMQPDGTIKRVQKCKKLADYGDRYRAKKDVKSLLEAILRPINDGKVTATATMSLTEFVEKEWLPYLGLKKSGDAWEFNEKCHTVAIATAYGYRRHWQRYLKPRFGDVALCDLRKRDVISFVRSIFEDIKGHV